MRCPWLLALAVTGLTLAGSPAFAQWVPDGVALCDHIGVQNGQRVISDGAGGALVVWEDQRGGNADIYVQRVSASGVPMWAADGVVVYSGAANQQDLAMAPDGSGGAIIAWADYRQGGTNADVYCRRVNGNGVPLWLQEVPICTEPGAQIGIETISDGAGGAIIVWRDLRNGTDYDIFAQRVDSHGVYQWDPQGVAVAIAYEDQTIPHLTSDGAGGAIIAWFDRRASADADVYAQRISHAGSPMWTTNGVVIAATDGVQRNPRLIPDGMGGALIAYWDSRGGDFDIYAQRVDNSGNTQWLSNGVAVCLAAQDQITVRSVPDGTGGVVMAWLDTRDGDWNLYAQRLDASGNRYWQANGVGVVQAAGSQDEFSMVADGAGGAFIAWKDARDENADIYAQRLTASGVADWAPDGLLLCSAPGDQLSPALCPDGAGGALVAWEDQRSGVADIYAQRVMAGGALWTPTPVAARASTFRAGEFFPNPTSGTAGIDVDAGDASEVRVNVYDVTGRAVRRGTSQTRGAQRLDFDGRDDDGRLLPGGVYFVRFTAGGESVSRRVVVTR
jgi:hypothetical protein